MRKLVISSVILVFLVPAISQAQGQEEDKDRPTHISLGYGPWGRTTSIEPQGEIVRGTDSSPITVHFPNAPYVAFAADYGRVDHLGFGVRFNRTRASATLAGSEPASSQVKFWGVPVRPGIVSTDPVDFSPTGYAVSADSKIQRFDGLLMWAHATRSGSIGIFGGLMHVTASIGRKEGTSQMLFIHNIPPGKPEDPKGILEQYTYASATSGTLHGFGPVGGFEGAICPTRNTLFQVRASEGILFAKGEAAGDWTWNKTGSLVDSSQGLKATPGANLFPPVQVVPSVRTSLSGKVWATELEASARFRHKGFQVGFGPVYSLYKGMPAMQVWTVAPGASPDHGRWTATKKTNLSSLHWVVSVHFRF